MSRASEALAEIRDCTEALEAELALRGMAAIVEPMVVIERQLGLGHFEHRQPSLPTLLLDEDYLFRAED